MARSLPERRDQSDEELMRRAQANDPGAFGQLYDRHAVRALRVARSVCRPERAEDAVQEGFLSIWRSRSTFRPESGSFQGWSMQIIRNRAMDAVRRDAASHRPPAANGEDVAGDATARSAHDEIVARDAGDALRASLSRIPDAQAEVIALAYYGELSHTEIAAHLSLPEGTVKGRMRLGLEKLRRSLEAPG